MHLVCREQPWQLQSSELLPQDLEAAMLSPYVLLFHRVSVVASDLPPPRCSGFRLQLPNPEVHVPWSPDPPLSYQLGLE